ncbi:MAG TPA: hypothetical protein VK548_09875 [Candidatus Acidoferrum sp.]|nr:hypothetical protein [Candidatus Acidoferrum sp.]
MIRSLAFVETATQAAAALERQRRGDVDALVALEPDAAWALSQGNHPYLKLEDGYRERDLGDLAEGILDEQQRWAEWLDRALGERIPEFSRGGFEPARLYLYWLKVMVDSLGVRLHALRWALEAWKPERVVHLGGESPHDRFGTDLLFREGLYSTLLRKVAHELRIDTEVVGASVDAPPAPDSWRKAGRRAVDRLRAAGVVGVARWQGRSPWLGSPAGAVVAGCHYDVRRMWRAARGRARFVPWEQVTGHVRRGVARDECERASGWLADAWSGITKEARFRRPFLFGGIDVWDIVEQRLGFWWHRLIPEQWAAFLAARTYFTRERPAAAVVAALGDHVERGAFAALRSAGVPTFIYQHGGFVGVCECVPWDCSDLWHADYELTYGDGVSKYFESRRARYGGARAESISVGSSRLDELKGRLHRSRRPRSRPRVLIVPNMIAFNNRYFDRGNMPDVTEAEVQASVVGLAREFPRYEFVLKTFPGQSDTPAARLAGRQGSNCRVEARRTLTRLLAGADLIVLTFPSTALLEAVVTDRPIVLLADRESIRLRAEARETLQRRLVLVEERGAFVDACRRVLREGNLARVPPPDESFARLYGVHVGDGRCAVRAVDAVLQRARAEAGRPQVTMRDVRRARKESADADA